ncbi:hypothetical protein B0H14DRAFT_2556198 [Mycena olivaceomarginata]|nr:hypothetical protein B0H14DRAFT_2556198 [Mycena olivaceomarginata]
MLQSNVPRSVLPYPNILSCNDSNVQSCRLSSTLNLNGWDITPNHSNLVETAHAGRNAETSIGVGLLTAILQSQVRDNAKAAELLQIEQKGVMRKRWNGVGEREKLSAQRKVWRMRKSAVRTDQLTSFESLKAERTAEIEEEKDTRRAWRVRQTEIDSELERVRKGPLAGVRINGRRPAERRLEEEPGLNTASEPVIEPLQISVALQDMSGNNASFYERLAGLPSCPNGTPGMMGMVVRSCEYSRQKAATWQTISLKELEPNTPQ